MPSYVIEFDSNHGPERRLFTLDDDRTLEVQLFQVLEELRQSDRILQGAPGDEVAVLWNGTELPLGTVVGALGVNASRPLVLRMRPRPVVVTPKTVSKYSLRHIVLPPVEGALGGLAAWAIGGSVLDLNGPLSSIDRADVAVALLLAGLIGLALSIGSVVRRLFTAPVAALCTVLAAASGVLVFGGLALLGDAPTIRQFLLARIVAWLLISIAMACVLTAPLRELGSQRWIEALVVATCAGLFGALIASLPGVSDLWQAVAFVICGALTGAAAFSMPVWRTVRVAAAKRRPGAVPAR